MSTTSAPVNTTQQREQVKPGKYSGAFAGFSLGAYNLLRASGVSKGAAHKIGSDYASDIARGMKESVAIASKVSKANKDGESVIRFNGKTDKQAMTFSMSIIRVAQIGEQLHTEKFVESRPDIHSVKLNNDLAEYLNDAEKWASKVELVD